MPGRLNVTLLTVLVALIAPGGLQAEVLRFDSRSQWTQWQMPADAIDITSSGGLQPVPMRKRNKKHRVCANITRRDKRNIANVLDF